MRNISAFVLLLTSILLSSCRDDYSICTLPKEVKFVAGFYKKIGATEITTSAPNLNISVFNTSNVVYSNQSNASSFSLALSPVTDTSKFVIRVENNLPADTLSIIYTSNQTLLSAECGNIIYHSISKILTTTNTIDSVKIIDSQVITGLGINAKLYF